MAEPDRKPSVPTSGQILGALVASLGIQDKSLNSKTAWRLFSGSPARIVKPSSKRRIFDALARKVVEAGLLQFRETPSRGVISPSTLAVLLEFHADRWDEFRAFLHPRTSKLERKNHPVVWTAYLRLLAIDLAIRTAAYLHLAEARHHSLEMIGSLESNTRGRFLNGRRQEAGLTREVLAEEVGVSVNTVDSWMYGNSRPSDTNILKIAGAFTRATGGADPSLSVAELRRFYWLSDIITVLEHHVGAERVSEVIDRFRSYCEQSYSYMESEILPTTGPEGLQILADGGAESKTAVRLLERLIAGESDPDWREDLKWVGRNWYYRIAMASHRVRREEVNDLNVATDGNLFKSWDITNPLAYEHYERSMDLIAEGKHAEALTEVSIAAQLDPLDPVYHFSIGSAKRSIGYRTGNLGIMEEAIEECWIAIRLDPMWILPWTEVGMTLMEANRPKDALEHLKSVPEDCGPLDVRYYRTLGITQSKLGLTKEAMESVETAFRMDPEDLGLVLDVVAAASMLGDKRKFRRYSKIARHLGAEEELISHLDWMMRERGRRGSGRSPSPRRSSPRR